MSEPLSLGTYLHLALALGATIPFDAAAAFALMAGLEGVIDVRLPAFLDGALQDELDALDDNDLHREAIARAGLCYLIVALRRELAVGTAEKGLASTGA